MRCGRALAMLGALVAAVLGGAVLGVGGAAAQSSGASPVRFADSALYVAEGRGPLRVVVERTDLPVSRVVVDFRTEDGGPTGGASAGEDYVHTEGTLVFDVGVSSSAFTVMMLGDEITEETEHLLLHLESSSGSGASTRVTIVDDDLAPAGSAADSVPPTSTPARSALAPPPTSPPPVVVASSAGLRRPASMRAGSTSAAARPGAPRRIILQQTPATPFELRPSGGAGGVATAVDPLLALGAGLLLARVAAEVWFRTRVDAG